jgi:membrane peptidoglycan carboxypeptidase
VGARRPLTRRRAFDRHSLLLKAADGRPLGRAGPLADAAARNAFPDLLVKAVLSIEDRRFYQHVGIDPLAILRAATVNLDSGGVAQGGAQSPSSS